MKLVNAGKFILVWGPVSQEGLEELKREGLPVLVPENRPFLLGLKHNIPLFKESNINFVYCTDNMLGLLFYKGKIKKTFLFYRESDEQALAGICGSLYVALLSKLHNVRVEILNEAKVDLDRLDVDASSLEGKNFILQENKEEYIIENDYELVEWGLLQ
ncbi:MAG: hypothetical protein JW734_02095 [Candidatus Omnitrophica bacterium]|nr:hypothetical protein [Candidatus Omnitrophota bacterium]